MTNDTSNLVLSNFSIADGFCLKANFKANNDGADDSLAVEAELAPGPSSVFIDRATWQETGGCAMDFVATHFAMIQMLLNKALAETQAPDFV